MKKFSITAFLVMAVTVLMAFYPLNNRAQSLVTISTQNGTNHNGRLEMSGASYLAFNFMPTTSQVAGQVSTGSYTVTISCAAPGTHLYMFTGGYSASSSTGSVTFTGVNVTGNSAASVY